MHTIEIRLRTRRAKTFLCVRASEVVITRLFYLYRFQDFVSRDGVTHSLSVYLTAAVTSLSHDNLILITILRCVGRLTFYCFVPPVEIL